MRSVLVSLRAVDPAVERAAASLGASPARVFWNIDVPLIAPGLFGGFLFAAILSMTEFSASLFMTAQNTQTLPVAMFNYTRDSADPSLAAISSILIVIVTILLVIATRWLGLARILSVQHGR
jgi:putative spermidine/putrescine transport system permease protein